jgi:hypothetical protein
VVLLPLLLGSITENALLVCSTALLLLPPQHLQLRSKHFNVAESCCAIHAAAPCLLLFPCLTDTGVTGAHCAPHLLLLLLLLLLPCRPPVLKFLGHAVH